MLDAANCILVVVDVQEAFASAIPDLDTVSTRIATMVRGAAILEIPIVVTEQYPKGLGRTVDAVSEALPDNAVTIEKTSFGAGGEPAFASTVIEGKRRQALLCGIETHVCVNQTAQALREDGFEVHLLADCVSSRYEKDKAAGLKRMEQAGVMTSSVEMALFELMRDAKHPRFKEIQALVK